MFSCGSLEGATVRSANQALRYKGFGLVRRVTLSGLRKDQMKRADWAISVIALVAT